MQRLHVVGFTTDHEALILSARRNAKSGGYMIIADADLEEALVDCRRPGRRGRGRGARPRPESTLSVREMQQRLRAGQTITEVADIAGVAEEWIARFAVPIQAEQALIIQRALDLVVVKQRVGLSSQPLGTSVWWNLQDRGAKLSEEAWSEGWSAFLVRDQVWVVQFAYEFRKKKQVAEWEVDLRTSSLHSRNRLATDLGYVEPGRRRRAGPPKPIPGGLVSRPAPAPASDPAEAPEAPLPARPATKRRAAKPAKRSAKKAPSKKAALKKTSAKRPAPRKSASRKGAAKRTPAKKTAVKRTATRRSTPRKAATKRPAAKKARPAAASAPTLVASISTERPRVLIESPANRPRLTPVIAGAAHAGGGGSAPLITPAPAPAVARRRPVGDDGRPVRRAEPLALADLAVTRQPAGSDPAGS